MLFLICFLLLTCSINAQQIQLADSGIVLRLVKTYYYYLAQTVTDWNNDNKEDILVGFIVDPIKMIYSENIGTETSPKFKYPLAQLTIPSS